MGYPWLCQKEMPVNNTSLKKLYCIVLLCAFFFSSNVVNAAPQTIQIENNRCPQKGIAFAFMNGVNTTFVQAIRDRNELSFIHGRQTSKNEVITYHILYNQTNGLLEDLVEVFEQRLQEEQLEKRYEYFFPTVRGYTSVPILSSTGTLAKFMGAIVTILSQSSSFSKFEELVVLPKLTFVLQDIERKQNTLADYRYHRDALNKWISDGKKILLVAHSQGNLFANVAYNYVQSKANIATPVFIRVVHIAPASIRLNGRYTLANLDLVINGLRLTGSVPAVTNDIPLPPRPPGLNGETDHLGHGLLEIYINPGLKDISASVKTNINTALNELTSPATLTVLANPGDMGGDSSSVIQDECPRPLVPLVSSSTSIPLPVPSPTPTRIPTPIPAP